MAWNVFKTYQLAKKVEDLPVIEPAAEPAHA
jgi:hypothetical protein